MLEKVDSNYPIETMLKFCEQSIDDTHPAAENMDPVDWENKPHTLLYKIYKEKMYDNPKSGYYILQQKEVPKFGLGFVPSAVDENIALGSTRFYVVPNVKNTMLWRATKATFILSNIMEEIGYKGYFYTFNEYNYTNGFMDLVRDGADRAIKDGVRRHMKKLPYSIMYNYTEQYVIYHLYNDDYEQTFLNKMEQIKVKDI